MGRTEADFANKATDNSPFGTTTALPVNGTPSLLLQQLGKDNIRSKYFRHCFRLQNCFSNSSVSVNISSFDNSKSLSNRQGNKVFVKQNCNSSSTVYSKHAFYHRMFLVEKKNGGYRPVLDLSPLNTFIETTHFKMENLATLKSLINPGDYMINIDLTDAYLSVPIHQESQKFLRFIWQNKAYQFKAMPFGLNVAPRVFTKLLKPVVAWLRGQGIRLIVYLDDILIMASSVELVKQHKQITIRLLESLGFLINYDKSMLIPTQRFNSSGC